MNIVKINLLFIVCIPYAFLYPHQTIINQTTMDFLKDLDTDEDELLFTEDTITQNIRPLNELTSPFFYLNGNTLQFTATTTEYTLRSLQPEDLETFIQYRSDPQIMKFIAGGAQTEDASKIRFDSLLNRVQNNNPMAWLALVKNKPKAIKGFVALGVPSSSKPGVAELIAFFNPDTQARGLGSMLLNECLTTYAPEIKRLGEEGFIEFQCFIERPLHTVLATVHQDNIAALKVLYKSKMIEVPQRHKLKMSLKPNNNEQENSPKTICFEYILP